MKAIVYHKYGSPDVLNLEDVAKPIPEDDEVLVRVRCASVNPYDWHLITGLPYLGRAVMGLFRPKFKTVGVDLSGEVEAVGQAVTRFRPGDEVFGMVNGATREQKLFKTGSFAEYVAVAEIWVEQKPTSLTHEQAAAVPLAAITALQGLRDFGKVLPGQKVLINGASGGVGTFAVQIAKSYGAEVTGVCSTKNLEMVRSIGADHVVDYTKDDFTSGDRRYDLILDNVGNRSLSNCRRVLTPEGMYLANGGQPANLWLGPLVRLLKMRVLSLFVRQKIVLLDQHRKKEDLGELKELIEAGKLKPIIDRTYPLVEIADAVKYLGKEHARGKVVITV